MRQLFLQMLILALVSRPVIGLAAPAEPATPATPGGGNPHAQSDHAATPATPAVPAQPGGGSHDDLDAGDLDERATNDLTSRHPELRDDARARWDAMTPEQREAFVREHPRLARRAARRNWEQMNPRERAEFVREHPELRQRVAERLRAMTPEQRREFVRQHPRVARQIHRRHQRAGHPNARPGERRPQGNNGVRDHGAGQGRDGRGQGGERRREGAGPRN